MFSTEQELLDKYLQDFSTDKVYSQLSVVQILRESVAELVAFIPELRALPDARQDEIEEKIVLFSLMIHDQAKTTRTDDGKESKEDESIG
jgi:hypothetical protein